MTDTAPQPPAEKRRRSSLAADLIVGVTNGVANIPDAMANALLAGVSPIVGLYALLAGTPAAALTTSSQFMTVAVTAAMAVTVGSGTRRSPGWTSATRRSPRWRCWSACSWRSSGCCAADGCCGSCRTR